MAACRHAHHLLRRGDQRTVLLQALAGALYWPIVSVHALNHELRRASEEVCDNAVVLAVPGAMDAGLADLLFWGSLAFSFVVAFCVTVPVNRWLIGRGLGHAVVHAYH